MKVAHVKTVDGTTIMINMTEDEYYDFQLAFYKQGHQIWEWIEKDEECLLSLDKIISVRFREVNS